MSFDDSYVEENLDFRTMAGDWWFEVEVNFDQELQSRACTYFLNAIKAAIRDRGMAVDDPMVFDPEVLENKASTYAAWSLETAKSTFEDHVGLLLSCGDDVDVNVFASDALVDSMNESRNYLFDDEECEIDLIINAATKAPST